MFDSVGGHVLQWLQPTPVAMSNGVYGEPWRGVASTYPRRYYLLQIVHYAMLFNRRFEIIVNQCQIAVDDHQAAMA